jgi:Mn2+/Fe2+ NRAMP family transporter
VINSIVAAPFMVVVMILARRKEVMGPFVVRGWLLMTAAMTLCIIGMIVSTLLG